jgi:hypothetical protein
VPASESPPGPLGLADTDPVALGEQVLACWDAFFDVVTAPGTDLTRPSRLRGWSGRDTCVHLGSWPESPVLDSVLDSARAVGGGRFPNADDANASLLAAHADATTAQVVDALRDARDRVAQFFASPDAVELGRSPSRSTVGPLPVLTLVHAGCYELAVHALDLAPCGSPPPAEHLLQRGLAALIDVTGALAARADVDLALTGQTHTGAGASPAAATAGAPSPYRQDASTGPACAAAPSTCSTPPRVAATWRSCCSPVGCRSSRCRAGCAWRLCSTTCPDYRAGPP